METELNPLSKAIATAVNNDPMQIPEDTDPRWEDLDGIHQSIHNGLRAIVAGAKQMIDHPKVLAEMSTNNDLKMAVLGISSDAGLIADELDRIKLLYADKTGLIDDLDIPLSLRIYEELNTQSSRYTNLMLPAISSITAIVESLKVD